MAGRKADVASSRTVNPQIMEAFGKPTQNPNPILFDTSRLTRTRPETDLGFRILNSWRTEFSVRVRSDSADL